MRRPQVVLIGACAVALSMGACTLRDSVRTATAPGTSSTTTEASLPDGTYLAAIFEKPGNLPLAKQQAESAVAVARSHGYPKAIAHSYPGPGPCQFVEKSNGEAVQSCISAPGDSYLLVLEGPYADSPYTGHLKTGAEADAASLYFQTKRAQNQAEAHARGLPYEVNVGYFYFASGGDG